MHSRMYTSDDVIHLANLVKYNTRFKLMELPLYKARYHENEYLNQKRSVIYFTRCDLDHIDFAYNR